MDFIDKKIDWLSMLKDFLARHELFELKFKRIRSYMLLTDLKSSRRERRRNHACSPLMF